MTRRPAQRKRALVALVPAIVVLAGCGGSPNSQNALAPKSHQSADIASLFWWMMGGAWIGLGIVVALLLWSWKRRRRRGLGGETTGDKPGEKAGWWVVVGAGVVLPIVIIAALFVVSNIFIIQTTQAPASSATRMTIDVIGHQFWWEVRYPGTTAVTANEIHIPARTPVRVNVTTADVIHSFWVPELNRKIDTIPGRTNAIELYADVPGRYRGDCAEFCGVQHAHMGLYVFADPPARFRRWLARQARPARRPATALARRGEQAFTGGSCSSCHMIRGTSAQGYVGPDLTHVASRTTLGALTIPNRPDYLRSWIVNSQHYKPGNQMPDIELSGSQLNAVVAYLEGLR